MRIINCIHKRMILNLNRITIVLIFKRRKNLFFLSKRKEIRDFESITRMNINNSKRIDFRSNFVSLFTKNDDISVSKQNERLIKIQEEKLLLSKKKIQLLEEIYGE